MDGFISLFADLLSENGWHAGHIFRDSAIELPGYFRPEKKWDLVAIQDGSLAISLECKSQVGPSFGNNFNNRTEEAIGSATDLWAAYREGAFRPSAKPWLGYLMLLEETPGSTRPVRTREPHFKVFPEFANSSYAKRYEILLTKLVRERLYDGACLLLSNGQEGRKGLFREPNPELGFEPFVRSFLAKAATVRPANP